MSQSTTARNLNNLIQNNNNVIKINNNVINSYNYERKLIAQNYDNNKLSKLKQ